MTMMVMMVLTTMMNNERSAYEIWIQKTVAQEKHQRKDDGTGQESHQKCADPGLWKTRHGHLTSQESPLQPCVQSHDIWVGRHHQGSV